MKVPELLSEIYRLLLEDRRSSATDLLVDFMYTNQMEFSGASFAQLRELSHGSPEEIVSYLRKLFLEHGLFDGKQLLEAANGDPHALNDDDIGFIEAVANRIESRSRHYIYDEEDSCQPTEIPTPCSAPSTLHQPPRITPPTCPPPPTPIDEDDDEEEYIDDESEHCDDDSEEYAYDPTSEENETDWVFSEEDDDDDWENHGCLSDDVEPFDDECLQAGNSRIMANLAVESADDYFDYDEDDDADDEGGGLGNRFEDIETSGSLTREERARQMAVHVAATYRWGRTGVELLAEIFEEHGWGQARIAVERLIENGISVDQLRLVKDMKDLWDTDEKYGLAFLKPHNRTDYSTYMGGCVLSWIMAAKIAELFPNGDICELECFLDKAFDAWYEGTAIKWRYPVFQNFLKHIVTWFDSERWLPGGLFFDDMTADDFDYEMERDHPTTSLYRNLADYGLVARHREEFLP